MNYSQRSSNLVLLDALAFVADHHHLKTFVTASHVSDLLMLEEMFQVFASCRRVLVVHGVTGKETLDDALESDGPDLVFVSTQRAYAGWRCEKVAAITCIDAIRRDMAVQLAGRVQQGSPVRFHVRNSPTHSQLFTNKDLDEYLNKTRQVADSGL